MPTFIFEQLCSCAWHFGLVLFFFFLFGFHSLNAIHANTFSGTDGPNCYGLRLFLLADFCCWMLKFQNLCAQLTA